MSGLPKADTRFPGADCLLCLGVATVANNSLTQHVKTLSHEDLAQLKAAAGDALRAKGFEVIVIQEPLDTKSLAWGKKGENLADKDYSPFQAKHQVDKLLVIQLDWVGVTRTYASYIPTSDPKAHVAGMGFIVDTRTNVYDLYLPIDVQKSAGLKWDEPPKFPGLTNAYYQAMESTRDLVLEALSK